MSIRIIFDSKREIPDHLQSQAEEKDGKFELDGSGVINKNKELLADNSTLRQTNLDLTADKEAAEASAKDWKGKAKLPAGHKVVSEDVAELGEAAKAAELQKDELPTLKTAKVDLQKQIDEFQGEKTLDEVAKANGYNARFIKLAREKGLKFEKATEKVNGTDTDVWNVLDAEGKKSKVSDFVTTDDYFKDFAETFTDTAAPNTRRFAAQQPDKSRQPVNKYDAIEQEVKEKQRVAPQAQGTLTQRFYNRTSVAAE
jgi:hypothetical protein